MKKLLVNTALAFVYSFGAAFAATSGDVSKPVVLGLVVSAARFAAGYLAAAVGKDLPMDQ